MKQLVSYAYLSFGSDILAFERGSYTSDEGEFVGKQSIGFGGHLNHDDLSLFDETPVGLFSNIQREIYEELYIFRSQLRDIIERISFVGYLVDSSTANGRRHLGLASCVHLRRKIELESPTLGIRNLRWISARHTPNSFGQFEVWSQYLFRYLQRAGNL
jgi:predicted NUDIX family phosphoesterase